MLEKAVEAENSITTVRDNPVFDNLSDYLQFQNLTQQRRYSGD